MLVRSQATNQRPADRTARTRDQNSHRASLQYWSVTAYDRQTFFNTKDGPIVLDLPPGDKNGSFDGNIVNVWQMPRW